MDAMFWVGPDETDGGFIAEALDRPGIMGQGETRQEAVEDAYRALLEARALTH